MASAYFNNTDETITYKVWTTDKESVTSNNVKFLTSNNITARLVHEEPKVIDYNGYQYRYSGVSGRVEFETTCDEQESMLKLLYGSKLKLLTVNVVTPNSIFHSI
jgi:hypothetical protein